MGASLVVCCTRAARAARAARAHTDFDRLKPMADDLKVPENKVPGCLSVVHASNLSMQYSWS